MNEPADLSELLSDLDETIIIRDLFTDYQDQVKQEQSNQKALESSQQSTSSREETNHDFSTSTESQENKQSEESKENVEGGSEEKHVGSNSSEHSFDSEMTSSFEINTDNSEYSREVHSDTNETSYSVSSQTDSIKNKKNSFQSEWGNIDYTQNFIVTSDVHPHGDIVSTSTMHTLKNDDLYFLIKSSNGKYSYAKRLFTNSSGALRAFTNTEHMYYELLGGQRGTARQLGTVGIKKPAIQFEFKEEFYRFYDRNKSEDPCRGKSLNYFLNWIMYWSDTEISIVKYPRLWDLEYFVRENNLNMKYEPDTIDYTKGLKIASEDSTDVDILSTDTMHTLKNDDLYFLIKSSNGKYSYAKRLFTNNSGVLRAFTNTEHMYYELLGGQRGTAKQLGTVGIKKPAIQFEFKEEFYRFYDRNKSEDPCRGQSLNYFLNWLTYWTDNEIKIVNDSEIDLYVAKQNNEVRTWHFFKEGRKSNRNQYFLMNLNDVTRLDFEINGSKIKRLAIFDSNRTKVFERSYLQSGRNTLTLDLPAGSYYIAMTDITAETTLQIRRHQFNDFQLSIDTNPERTHIYLNGVFHQELTDIYAPHHRPLQLPTAVSVSNTLNSVWRTSRGSHPVLDAMFGKNYLLGTNLREQTFPTVGNLPLGSTSLSAPLQYVGNGQFYTDAQIVNFGPQQRFVITGSTLLLAMAGTLVVYYAAHLIHTNQLQLTTPSIFREFETGSWEELEKFTYHGIVSYEGKTYGVNDETGEIKNTETGEELPKSVIPDDIRKSAAGASKLAINKILAELNALKIENVDDEYEWYTFKDLVQDELEGQGNKRGHTIEKHVMKSDTYLKNRLNTDNLLFSSTYYGVVEALIAINVTKLKHPEVFQNVGKQKGQFIETPFKLGRGFTQSNIPVSPLYNNQLYLMPSTSDKGFRVLTSYPVFKVGD